MITDKQDKKDRWEKEHMQRVLDYHNRKYGTHIKPKDKSIVVYPHLKGQTNWDWVCYDTKTGDEIAVEVKKITDCKLEGRGNIIWDILEEIKDNLSNKLPGTFSLYIDIPKNYYLPLRGQRNKQGFKNILYEAIFQIAQRLKLEERESLTPHLGQLPFALPDTFLCALQKVSDEGSMLRLGSGATGWWSTELDEHELEKFEQLISHANEQLRVAQKEFNVKQTFLVIIEEGYRITYPDTLADAIKRINHTSYSHINHIYYVSGEEVKEVS